MKPGDKVYHVDPRHAVGLVYLKPIKAGIYIGAADTDPRWPKAVVHFGWVQAEEVASGDVFATDDEAKARVAALVKKRIADIGREMKKLSALDMGRVKTQDRTGQIKKAKLARLLGGGQ